jgi:hypothetical protein
VWIGRLGNFIFVFVRVEFHIPGYPISIKILGYL